jgi:hypothetical protein
MKYRVSDRVQLIPDDVVNGGKVINLQITTMATFSGTKHYGFVCENTHPIIAGWIPVVILDRIGFLL